MKILGISRIIPRAKVLKPQVTKPLTLADLNGGDIAEITGLSNSSTGSGVSLRLLEMGFAPGASVQVNIKTSGINGITIFTNNGCKIAIKNSCADLFTCKKTGTVPNAKSLLQIAKDMFLAGKDFFIKLKLFT